MVAPPGEQTLSLSWPGCCSESSSILAAPCHQREASRCGDTLLPPTLHPSTLCTSLGPDKEGPPPEDQENTDQQSLGPKSNCQAPREPHLHTPISQSVQGSECLQEEDT